MKRLNRIGRILANPFILATLLWAALYGFAQLFNLIPGPYMINGISTPNRIAAFEVDKAMMLASIVVALAYTLFIHPARTVHESAAKMVIALLVFLQTIEFGNRIICKMAQNSIVAAHGGWRDEDAKGLCARTIGDWPVKFQIAAGILVMGIISWKYLAQTRFGSSVSRYFSGRR